MTETTLKTLGRYQLLREIGRGMMGVVYEALDPDLGRTVALKTVRLAFSIPPEESAAFERRFLAEARVAARLSHPGIVVVHDVGRDPASGTLFIAFEHLEGQTLAEQTAGAPLPWRDALRLTAGIARALHHAHAQGIVHRDVKPANVMVLPTGDPKIMDFGIAKVPASQLTAAGEFFGTPSYMSPEQTAGDPVDGRSDLFSLGAVLYLLLTGRRAFDAGSVPAILAQVGHHDPSPPTGLVPGLPREVDYLLARSLAKAREDRYPDGQTFAEDLDDVLAGRSPRHRAAWTAPVADRTVVSGAARSASPPRVHREPSTPPAKPVTPPAAKRAPFRHPALAAGGALLAAAVLGLALTRGSAPIAGPPPAPALGLPALVTPAQLQVEFEHHLQWGTLRVFVDDVLAFEEPLESRVVKKVLTVRIRKGTVSKVVDIAPGPHQVRVQVQGDGYDSSRSIRGTFDSGAARRLSVGLSRLGKDVSVQWGTVTRE